MARKKEQISGAPREAGQLDGVERATRQSGGEEGGYNGYAWYLHCKAVPITTGGTEVVDDGNTIPGRVLHFLSFTTTAHRRQALPVLYSKYHPAHNGFQLIP